MASALPAIAILGGLSLFFGIVLAVAYRFLRVEEDPRIDDAEDLLPGSNCGACGEPGCRAFAEKLVAGAVAPSACTVSSPETVDAIADLLGVDAGAADPRVARLRCAGSAGLARNMASYQGEQTCAAAAIVSGGGKGCAWGCLGLADCEVVCGFDAIQMTPGGLPSVDPVRCTACGDCVEACPRDLFVIHTLRHPVFVQCSAPLSGDEAREVCAVACDACGRCAADAEGGRIVMENNLPVVDYSGDPLGPEVTYRCPTAAIQYISGGQFREEPES